MNIKSKKWYEGQIKALENAVKNTASFMNETPYNATPRQLEDTAKHNSGIQAECKKIYKRLNQLKEEYWLYYK